MLGFGAHLNDILISLWNDILINIFNININLLVLRRFIRLLTISYMYMCGVWRESRRWLNSCPDTWVRQNNITQIQHIFTEICWTQMTQRWTCWLQITYIHICSSASARTGRLPPVGSFINYLLIIPDSTAHLQFRWLFQDISMELVRVTISMNALPRQFPWILFQDIPMRFCFSLWRPSEDVAHSHTAGWTLGLPRHLGKKARITQIKHILTKNTWLQIQHRNPSIAHDTNEKLELALTVNVLSSLNSHI